MDILLKWVLKEWYWSVWAYGIAVTNSRIPLKMWNCRILLLLLRFISFWRNTALCSGLHTATWFPLTFSFAAVSFQARDVPHPKFQLEPGSCADVIFLAAGGLDIPWAEKVNWGLMDLQTILGSEQLSQEGPLWAASEATCPWNFSTDLFPGICSL